MMIFEKLRFLPLFEEEGSGGTGGSGGTNDPEGREGNNSQEGSKTFTQEDLNRVGAREKRQGIASILKTLGFEDEDSAKVFVEKYRKEEQEKKDELTIANESIQIEKKAKEEAEKKAAQFEKQLKVLSMGVSVEHVEDVVVLADAKTDDNTTFEDALENIKKTYPNLFSSEPDPNQGTGGSRSNPPRKKASDDSKSIGKRLAEQKRSTLVTKNPYFK